MIASSGHFAEMDSPVGRLRLGADASGLRWIHFLETRDDTSVPPGWRHDASSLQKYVRQLQAYFDGDCHTFDLPVAPDGTAFQVQAWSALRTIPFGATLSYGQQAQRIGRPRAARAVGSANRRNPIPIVIPCHRVVGAGGDLVGFAGGLAIKRWLLDHEQAILAANR